MAEPSKKPRDWEISEGSHAEMAYLFLMFGLQPSEYEQLDQDQRNAIYREGNWQNS